MGYSEMYCLACGGPCVSLKSWILEERYDDANTRNEKIKIKKAMNRLSKIDLKWIDKWVAVTENGIYNGIPDGDFPIFLTDLTPLDEKYPELKEDLCCTAQDKVFAFHKSCWTVIGNPTFQELSALHLKRKPHENTVCDTAYPFNSLMTQEFEYENVNPSLCFRLEDPLCNEQSRQGVIDTWAIVKTVIE